MGELLGHPGRHRRAVGPHAAPIPAARSSRNAHPGAGSTPRRARAARPCAARAWRDRRASWSAHRRTRPRPRRPRGRGHESRHTIRFAFNARSTAAPASAPSGTTSIPIASRTPGEPREQLRRLDRLDDDRRRDAAPGEPRGGEVEAAEVREREDQPVARVERGLDVLPADGVEPGLDRLARVLRQSEELEPVATVRRERVRDRALQRAPLEPPGGRARRGCGRRADGDRRGTARARARPLRRSASRPVRATRSRARRHRGTRGTSARSATTEPVRPRGGQGRLRRAARAWRRASRRASGPRCSRQRASIGTRSSRRPGAPFVRRCRASKSLGRAGRSDAWRHTLMKRCTAGDRGEDDHHPEHGDRGC